MTQPNALLEESTTSILATVNAASGMAAWTDEKRKEYSKLFGDRSEVAQYILVATAAKIWAKASRIGYVSGKHNRSLVSKANSSLVSAEWATVQFNMRLPHGDRKQEDLLKIADDRADEILRDLPPIRKAMSVISPELAAIAERIDAIEAEGTRITERLEELTEPIVARTYDRKMPLGDFLDMIDKRESDRLAALVRLKKITEEGGQLKTSLAKGLYAGVPGLTEAVVDVVAQHVQRSTALSEVTRRVDERVRFGDCPEAIQLLSQFEKDEAAIPTDLKKKITAACAALQLGTGKAKRAKKGAK